MKCQKCGIQNNTKNFIEYTFIQTNLKNINSNIPTTRMSTNHGSFKFL